MSKDIDRRNLRLRDIERKLTKMVPEQEMLELLRIDDEGLTIEELRKDIDEIRGRWRAENEALELEDRLAMAVQLRKQLYRTCLEKDQTRTADLQLAALEKLWGLHKADVDQASFIMQWNWGMLPEAGSDHAAVSELEAKEYLAVAVPGHEDEIEAVEELEAGEGDSWLPEEKDPPGVGGPPDAGLLPEEKDPPGVSE